jgi:hypothetical protein
MDVQKATSAAAIIGHPEIAEMDVLDTDKVIDRVLHM